MEANRLEVRPSDPRVHHEARLGPRVLVSRTTGYYGASQYHLSPLSHLRTLCHRRAADGLGANLSLEHLNLTLLQDHHRSRGVRRRNPSQALRQEVRHQANRNHRLWLPQRHQSYRKCQNYPSPNPDGSHPKARYQATHQASHPIMALGGICPKPAVATATTTRLCL